jgi:hypothetical protein
MPVLALRDTPPSRYPDKAIVDSKHTWWIAKTKPRQEKALANDLLKRNIEYYLPYYTKLSPRTDSTSMRKTLLPLFPSYVPFAYQTDPWTLLQLNRISTILPIKAQKKFKLELNQIYLICEKNISIIPVETQILSIGQKVGVVNGPLKGLVGEIVNFKGTQLLLLNVDGLGNACVSIDINYVEALKSS